MNRKATWRLDILLNIRDLARLNYLEQMGDIRAVYTAAAAVAVELIERPEIAARWENPSVLDGMTIGSLAAHLARSILQVGWFLDRDITNVAEPVSAVTYYARLAGTMSRSSVLNSGVEARSAETAILGALPVATEARASLERLRVRLPNEDVNRRVAVAHRPGEEIVLDEYLRTRLVELAVHTDDLALSINVTATVPMAAISTAVDLLVAAARERHGDIAVLQALARRERDIVMALRVL